MSAAPNPDSFLPLKPVVLHILLVLSEGRAHGYEIMQTVSERTEGAVEISTAVLYRTLSRLLKQGLVAETQERPDPAEDDSRRRYYRVTALGSAVVTSELARLRSLLKSRSVADLLRTADRA